MKLNRRRVLMMTTALLAPSVANAQAADCDFEELASDIPPTVSELVVRGAVLGGLTAGALVLAGVGPLALLGFAGVSVATGFAPALRRVQQRSANLLIRSLEEF